jgi:D-sedoheptulose 7-phosphate isomerase
VLAISTSGNSPNVVEAVELARRRGARTVGFTGQDGGHLARLADRCVHAPSEHVGRQEDVHQILDHVVASTLRGVATRPGASPHHAAPDEDRVVQGLVEDYLTRVGRTIRELPRDPVARVAGLLMDAWRNRRRILLLGNGGSAATASHMMNDLSKLTLTEGWPRVKALALSDNVPLLTAWANDASFERVFVEPLLTWLEPRDVVVGISTSGNSPNVVEALAAARAAGAVTVGFTGSGGGRVAALADVCVRVPSEHIGRQEDLHLVLDHVVADTMRRLARGHGAARPECAEPLELAGAGAGS